jgi:hypothetical protein
VISSARIRKACIAYLVKIFLCDDFFVNCLLKVVRNIDPSKLVFCLLDNRPLPIQVICWVTSS